MNKDFEISDQKEVVVIFAPGPSLTKDQVEYVYSKGVFTITLGDAYLLADSSDILYHCDARWWQYYKGVPEVTKSIKVAYQEVPEHPEIHKVKRSSLRTGFDPVIPFIVGGGNSGYQAIHLAAHYRPKKVILLGYDMKVTDRGKYNVRGVHPKELGGPTGTRNISPPQRNKFDTFIKKISNLKMPLKKEGIEVYNCSPDSLLNCFPKRRLEDVL